MVFVDKSAEGKKLEIENTAGPSRSKKKFYSLFKHFKWWSILLAYTIKDYIAFISLL